MVSSLHAKNFAMQRYIEIDASMANQEFSFSNLESDAPHVVVDGLGPGRDGDVAVVVLHRHETVLAFEHCKRSENESNNF